MLSISSAKIGDEKLNFSAHFQWNIVQGGMNSFCCIPDADRGNQADHWQISLCRWFGALSLLEEEAGTLPAPYFSPAKEMGRVKNCKRKMQRLQHAQNEAV